MISFSIERCAALRLSEGAKLSVILVVVSETLLLLIRRNVTVHHLVISLLLLVHIVSLLVLLHLVVRLMMEPKVSGIDVGLVVVRIVIICCSSIGVVLVVEIGVDVVLLLLLLRLFGVDDPSAKGLLATLWALVRRQRELLLHKGRRGRRLLGFNVAGAAAARCRVG